MIKEHIDHIDIGFFKENTILSLLDKPAISVLCNFLQFASDANYASLVVGFPELEFSSNEVYAWPKSEEAVKYVQ